MKKMASDSIEKEHECEDFVIDIPLALEPALWPECCIYKIPKKLYEVNKEAYIPKLVSIGPFHHRREELRNMEIEKLRYLREFCYRTRKNHEDLRKIIKENEVKIRHCYSEECRVLNSKDFVKMILLDAIFIIELFWRNKYDENDYIANKPWLANGIRYDLILLENQLPFFVLEKLYTFTFTDSTTTFLELSLDYFPSYGIQQPKFNIEEVKHFTDLIRYLFCLAPDLKPTGYLDNLYCATKLDMAGLKFKAVEDHRRLLEIKLPENSLCQASSMPR